MDKNETISKFIHAAIQHGVGITGGNSKLANKSYKIVNECYLGMKEHKYTSDLINLLEHEDYSVRLWAASYVLNIDTSNALVALRNVVEYAPPLISFSAEMTIKEWELGNLQF